MSAAVASASAAALTHYTPKTSNPAVISAHNHHHNPLFTVVPLLSRYESQKRRDWNTFGQYLSSHSHPMELTCISGAHVLEFLQHLDQFGETKVHADTCPFFGFLHAPDPCACPSRESCGRLDAVVGRLRVAFEERGGETEANPFGSRAVRVYLREARDAQARGRGMACDDEKTKTRNECKEGEVCLGRNVRNGSNGGRGKGATALLLAAAAGCFRP